MNTADPLPTEALLAGHAVLELCGEACLTGSAPLTKYFWNLSRETPTEKLPPAVKIIFDNIKSNDIDTFAPFCPTKLADSRAEDKIGITKSYSNDADLVRLRKNLLDPEYDEFSFTVF